MLIWRKTMGHRDPLEFKVPRVPSGPHYSMKVEVAYLADRHNQFRRVGCLSARKQVHRNKMEIEWGIFTTKIMTEWNVRVRWLAALTKATGLELRCLFPQRSLPWWQLSDKNRKNPLSMLVGHHLTSLKIYGMRWFRGPWIGVMMSSEVNMLYHNKERLRWKNPTVLLNLVYKIRQERSKLGRITLIKRLTISPDKKKYYIIHLNQYNHQRLKGILQGLSHLEMQILLWFWEHAKIQ
jgi:hypothetical protein